MWAWKEPGCCSGSGPLFLIAHTLCTQGWEGPGIQAIDPEQMLQDLTLAGLRVGLGTPQELVVGGVAVGHLPVLQVALLHPHFGEQLRGLPTDAVLLPCIHPHDAQCFPDLLLKGRILPGGSQPEASPGGQPWARSAHRSAWHPR